MGTCSYKNFENDDDNPEYIFSCINTSLLIKTINNEINLKYLAKKEMVNRGLGKNGEWVGFEKSKKIFKIK